MAAFARSTSKFTKSLIPHPDLPAVEPQKILYRYRYGLGRTFLVEECKHEEESPYWVWADRTASLAVAASMVGSGYVWAGDKPLIDRMKGLMNYEEEEEEARIKVLEERIAFMEKSNERTLVKDLRAAEEEGLSLKKSGAGVWFSY